MTVRASSAKTMGVAALLLLGLAAGCAPQALEQSQRRQLAAMVQYRDEMAAYHGKVKAQFEADNRRELDVALEASLRQTADGDGRVALATALEKVRKRDAKEAEFRAGLARLDRQFAERQAAIGRAVDLAQQTLGLLEDYSRLGALLRSLFVREIEARELVGSLQTEGSVNHAGSGSEPEAGGR